MRALGALLVSLVVAQPVQSAAWARPAATAARSDAVVHETIRQTNGALARLELHLQPDARKRPQIVLMTLGGPIYCMQLESLARLLHASRACADYGRNRYTGTGTRSGRLMDWGDPAYLAAVATIPDRLRGQGIRIDKLALVGVSYSGYANAGLVARHPEMKPDALVIADTYLDLASRFRALPTTHETYREIVASLGGTLEQVPAKYHDWSPSSHLAGLARAIRGGMAFVDVWSVSAAERREFAGATCSLDANARWLARLATLSGRPVDGYVTTLRHGHALWNYGSALLVLGGLGTEARPLPARRIAFEPGKAAPAPSYCTRP